MPKPLLALLFLAALGAVWWFGFRDPGTSAGRRSVAVQRGDIVRHAVAVGRVEAEREVQIKSLYSGVCGELLVKQGDLVEKGQPLAQVDPVITAVDHIQAERALEAAIKAEEITEETVEGKNVQGSLMRFLQGDKSMERMRESARLTRQQAQERLDLLREGKVSIADRQIDRLVRATAAGHVVEINVREGSPIIQSSSYGSGTVLCTIADLRRLVFRGTVDEIDVGKLEAGMQARIEVGALPELELDGKVGEIGLRAQRSGNAVVFALRIDLAPRNDSKVTLRSGYSAVARVEIARRSDVLFLPERVLRFRQGRAFVAVPEGPEGRREVEVQTGLSDGLRIEITAGLGAGAEVLEPN